MKSALVVSTLLLMLSIFSAAQHKDFTLKGHTFGEPFAEFWTKTTDSNPLATCADLSHRKPGSFASYSQKLDREAALRRCDVIKSASQGARSNFFVKELGEVQFDDGKLVGMRLSFMNSLKQEQVPFVKIREDAVQTYGPPTEEGNLDWQNGFGATFHPRYATWNLDLVVITIEESPKTIVSDRSADVDVTFLLKSEVEKMRKDQISGPNVFGKAQ